MADASLCKAGRQVCWADEEHDRSQRRPRSGAKSGVDRRRRAPRGVHVRADHRRSLAADGISSISRDASALVRYRDRIFVVVDARAVDRSIDLDLGPPEIELRSADPSANLPTRDLLPRFLAETFLRRDLLFAAC